MKRLLLLCFITATFLAAHQGLHAQSSGFCWVEQERSTGFIIANDVALRSGDIYTTGEFFETATFDQGGANQTQFTSAGSRDGYVARYDNEGNLIWVVRAGTGSSLIIPRSISAVSSGIYVSGWFQGTATFGSGGNQTNLVSQDGNDIFIAKYDVNGNFQWARAAVGPQDDRPFDIDGPMIIGTFQSTVNFGGGTILTSAGAGDIFVAEYNSISGNLESAIRIGGPGDDRGYGIEEELVSGVIITGEFSDTVTFGDGDPNETELMSRGDKDIFVAKFSFNGALDWAVRAGGTGDDRSRHLAAEENDTGGVFITGWFANTADFGPKTVTSKGGGGDIFIARYDLNGNVVSVNQAGGPVFDKASKVAAIRLNDSGGPQFATGLITGEFRGSIVFEEGKPDETTLTSNGQRDIFVAKYTEFGEFLWAKQFGGDGEDLVRGIVEDFYRFTQDNLLLPFIPNSFIVGAFAESISFGTLPPTTVTSVSNHDAFVTRLSDFIPPNSLDIETITNTPYVRVSWEPPINVLAPTLNSPSSADLNTACSFDDGTPGTIYRISANYNDPEDGDVNNSTQVNFVDVFAPRGGRADFLGSPVNATGNGFSGTVNFDACVRFGAEESIDLTFAILDAGEHVSNFVTATQQNPDASAPLASNFLYADPPPRSQANEPVCGASNNLIGYNIFRDNTFLTQVPAHQTQFIDETLDPDESFLWRVTAVYAEGESEHIGVGGSSGSSAADNLFERVADNDVADGGGFSASGIWGDYNNDGFVDMFVPNLFGNENFLIQNNSGATFTKRNLGDVVTNYGDRLVGDGGWSYTGSWGDYNNDGRLDLFIANAFGFGIGQENFLLRNVDNNSFEVITTGDIATDRQESFSGVWGDYDNDGFLDLFVANGVNQVNSLYRNTGNGAFQKITSGDIVNEASRSRSALWVDYDNDGDIDLFVANDGVNFFYQNDGAPNYTFTKLDANDVGTWIQATEISQGVSCADYDNDGDADLFIANNKTQNLLLQNQGAAGNYSFVPVNQGVFVQDVGFSLGSSWGDYNNDGFIDLMVTNLAADIFNTDDNANFFYMNAGNGAFQKLVQGNLIYDNGASSGCSWGDFDRDGFVDVFVANGSSRPGQQNFLYRNKRADGGGNSWISVKCNGAVTNRAAIGARVRVLADIDGNGAVWQVREISAQTGGGWGGQNSLNADFGLGSASTIDSLIIEWPLTEESQVFTDVNVSQNLTVTEPLPQNQTPNALNDQVALDEDTETTISVLSNDDDPDGDELTINSITQPSNGSASIVENNTKVRYTPDDNYNGPDNFTYTITDDEAVSSAATVSITVTPVNDQPVLNNIADQSLIAGQTRTVTVTASDVDDGETLIFSAEPVISWISFQENSGSSAPVANKDYGGQVSGRNGGKMTGSVARPLLRAIRLDKNFAAASTDTSVNIILSPPAEVEGNFNITVEVRDSENATDTQTFDIRVDPPTGGQLPSIQHSTESVTLNMKNNGVYDGFTLFGQDALARTIGGFIAATGPNRVAVNLSAATQNFQNLSGFQDFSSSSVFDQITTSEYEEGSSIYAGSPIGIRVRQTSYSVDEEKVVLVGFEIANISGSSISNLYVGQLADFDVGLAALNRGGYDDKRNLVFQFEQGGENNANYYGIQLLLDDQIAAASGARVENIVEVSPDSLYRFISNFSGFGPIPINADADYRSFIGAGPLTLSAGAQIRVGFAWVAGETLGDLQGNADIAQELWQQVVTSVAEAPTSELPESFVLEQNYPNPFNPTTKIRYEIPQLSPVRLEIYNMLGQTIRTLVDETQPAGIYEMVWDGKDDIGRDVPTGIYFLKLRNGQQSMTRKMILMQ